MEKPKEPIYLFRDQGFTHSEIERIKEIVAQHWTEGRKKISQMVCEELNWHQANGRLKEVACREALRKIAKLGLVTLPPKKHNGGFKFLKPLTAEKVGFQKPQIVIAGKLDDFGPLCFRLVSNLNCRCK